MPFFIFVGCDDGSIKIYNTSNGDLEKTLVDKKTGAFDAMPTTCLKWRPSGSGMKSMGVLVSLSADGTIYHWHAPSGKMLFRFNDDPKSP